MAPALHTVIIFLSFVEMFMVVARDNVCLWCALLPGIGAVKWKWWHHSSWCELEWASFLFPTQSSAHALKGSFVHISCETEAWWFYSVLSVCSWQLWGLQLLVFSLSHQAEELYDLNRDWAFFKQMQNNKGKGKKKGKKKEVLCYKCREKLEDLTTEESKLGCKLTWGLELQYCHF